MRSRNTGQRKNEEPSSLPVPRLTERAPGREMVIGFCLSALFFILVWSALSNFWHERSSPELQRGLAALAQNQEREAQHFFDSVLRGRPEKPEIYLRIIQESQRHRQWNVMVHYAEQGIQNCKYAEEPIRAALYASLSIGYLGQGRKEDALLQAKRAWELNREDPTFLNHYGYMLADLGSEQDLDKAEALIKLSLKKLRALPDTPEARWELATVEDSYGWVCYKRGKYQEAVAILSQALDKVPENIDSGDSLKEMYYHLGAAYCKIYHLEDALSMLEVALRYDPNYEAAIAARKEVYRRVSAWFQSPNVLPGPRFNTSPLFTPAPSPSPSMPSPLNAGQDILP